MSTRTSVVMEEDPTPPAEPAAEEWDPSPAARSLEVAVSTVLRNGPGRMSILREDRGPHELHARIPPIILLNMSGLSDASKDACRGMALRQGPVFSRCHTAQAVAIESFSGIADLDPLSVVLDGVPQPEPWNRDAVRSVIGKRLNALREKGAIAVSWDIDLATEFSNAVDRLLTSMETRQQLPVGGTSYIVVPIILELAYTLRYRPFLESLERYSHPRLIWLLIGSVDRIVAGIASEYLRAEKAVVPGMRDDAHSQAWRDVRRYVITD
jgi:hypothetical protein